MSIERARRRQGAGEVIGGKKLYLDSSPLGRPVQRGRKCEKQKQAQEMPEMLDASGERAEEGGTVSLPIEKLRHAGAAARTSHGLGHDG